MIATEFEKLPRRRLFPKGIFSPPPQAPQANDKDTIEVDQSAVDTAESVDVVPSSDTSEATVRMSEIHQILDHAATPVLDRAELVVEWIRLLEWSDEEGQHVPPSGGRQPGEKGIRRAARELPLPGATEEARRKYVQRAIKIAAITPEGKQAARDASLENNQCALLAVAKQTSLDAQVEKAMEIATRPRATRRSKASADNIVVDDGGLSLVDGEPFELLNRHWGADFGFKRAWECAPWLDRKRFANEVLGLALKEDA